MNEFIQILEEQGYDSHWDAGQGILVIDNAKQSEFKRIRKILEKAKYKGSFSVSYWRRKKERIKGII